MSQRAKGLIIRAAIVAVMLAVAYAEAPVKHAYMIYGPACLTKVELGRDSFLFAPMKDDGTPDRKLMKARGVIVTYDPNCGIIALKTDEEMK